MPIPTAIAAQVAPPVVAPVVATPCCQGRAWVQSPATSGQPMIGYGPPNPSTNNIPVVNTAVLHPQLGNQPIQNVTNIPGNVAMVMPTITTTAQVTIPSPQPALAPQDLVRPLPSITASAPVALPPACDGVNQWLGQNPLMAVGILAALAYFTFKR